MTLRTVTCSILPEVKGQGLEGRWRAWCYRCGGYSKWGTYGYAATIQTIHVQCVGKLWTETL